MSGSLVCVYVYLTSLTALDSISGNWYLRLFEMACESARR